MYYKDKNIGSQLDGVVISTPTSTHRALICEGASYRLSIFIEKPVDETSDEIRESYSLTRRYGVKLCCGFQRRFDPSYLSLYQKVQTLRAIGTPLSASIFFGDHPVPPRSFLLAGCGNIISDCSAHNIDFIRWVLQDEVYSVYATGTSSDEELRMKNVIDNATMVMKFVKGESVVGVVCLFACIRISMRRNCRIFVIIFRVWLMMTLLLRPSSLFGGK